MKVLASEDLRSFAQSGKPVYWHKDWIKVRKHLGEEDFFAGEKNPITIIKVWEDPNYPGIIGVYFRQNTKPGYIAMTEEGKALSKELDYPVFSDSK